MSQLMLNEHQRQLLKFSRSNILKFSTDNDTDIKNNVIHSNWDFVQIPNQNDKNTTISQFYLKIDSIIQRILEDQDWDVNKRLIDMIK